MTRVLYLANTDLGWEMYHHLRWIGGEVVFEGCNDYHIKDWSKIPPYDLGVNFLATHKIPSSEFTIPYRWLNFHPAPLPEYKGRNLAYHAIINGEKEFGATLHYMAPEYDTGPIIEVKKFPIENHHTSGDLVKISHQLLKELFIKWVPRILNGEEIPSTPQNKGEGRYYKKSPLCEEISIPDSSKIVIRALTCHPKHHAQITISGKKYKIIPCEE